jgi:hypothetical protein
MESTTAVAPTDRENPGGGQSLDRASGAAPSDSTVTGDVVSRVLLAFVETEQRIHVELRPPRWTDPCVLSVVDILSIARDPEQCATLAARVNDAGAGLDALEVEPVTEDPALVTARELLCHLAGAPDVDDAARVEMRDVSVELDVVRAFLRYARSLAWTFLRLRRAVAPSEEIALDLTARRLLVGLAAECAASARGEEDSTVRQEYEGHAAALQRAAEDATFREDFVTAAREVVGNLLARREEEGA